LIFSKGNYRFLIPQRREGAKKRKGKK